LGTSGLGSVQPLRHTGLPRRIDVDQIPAKLAARRGIMVPALTGYLTNETARAVKVLMQVNASAWKRCGVLGRRDPAPSGPMVTFKKAPRPGSLGALCLCAIPPRLERTPKDKPVDTKNLAASAVTAWTASDRVRPENGP
jgi:hypothetical protein